MLGIHFHDIKLKKGKSYIKSPNWLFSKTATTNPKTTKDNKSFQYAITVALNHREVGKDPQRISKNRPHINKYNWRDIDFPAGTDEYKKFERNNNDIALNISYAPHNKKEIKLAYKSKYNRKRKNQVVLLIITDNKQWHYTALKSIPTADGHIKPIEAYLNYTEESHQIIMETSFVLVVFIHIESIMHLENMKHYVRNMIIEI